MGKKHFHRAYPISGFTLIEMAIVIVIIGLIIGGAIAGKDLIEKAELRSVLGDIEKFQTAGRTFQTMYNALPGDFKDAEAYWGSDTNCPNTPYTTIPHTATCNGDGNGLIGNINLANDIIEGLRLWQHLSNAGLISGKFSATSQFNYGPLVLGQNAPASKINGSGYMIVSITDSHASTYAWLYYQLNFDNTLLFGQPTNNGLTIRSAISTEAAYWLDSKVDDGLPASGKIVTWKYGNGYNSGTVSNNCANSTSTAYNLSIKGIQCSLVWRKIF